LFSTAETNKCLFEQFFFFFIFFILMQLIYFGQKPNEITFFLLCCEIKEKKKVDTNEVFAETTRNKKFQKNLINGAKL